MNKKSVDVLIVGAGASGAAVLSTCFLSLAAP